MKELVDDNDATQTAWAKEEVISLKEYLQYCIAMNWIDVSKLDLNDKYSDSTEVYDKLLDYTINAIDHTTEFQKRFYKYRRFIRENYLRKSYIFTYKRFFND